MSEATGLHGLNAAARDGVLREITVSADMHQAVLRKSAYLDQVEVGEEDDAPSDAHPRVRFQARPWQMTVAAAAVTLLLLWQWHWEPPSASRPQATQAMTQATQAEAGRREQQATDSLKPVTVVDQSGTVVDANGAMTGGANATLRAGGGDRYQNQTATDPVKGVPSGALGSVSMGASSGSAADTITVMALDSSGTAVTTGVTGALPAAVPPNDSKRLAVPAAQPGVKIVYNADLELVVKDARAASSQVQDLALKSGGYVSDANVVRGATTQVDDGQWNGRVVLRIPVGAYAGAVEQIKSYGRVLSERQWTQDVTDQYQDLSARIHTLRQHEERLLELVTKADKFEDWLKLSGALNDTRAAIEKAEGQQKLLDNKVQYATLTVSLLQVPPSTPALLSGTGFWGRAGATLSASWHALVGRVEVLAFWAIYALPYLVMAAVVAGVVTAFWLRRRRQAT